MGANTPRKATPQVVYQKKDTTTTVKKTVKTTYLIYKTTTRLNYRTGPGTNYKIAGTFSKGKEVQVEKGYSKSSGTTIWYRVRVNGKDYYSAAKYLKSTGKSKTVSSIVTTSKKVAGEKRTASTMLEYLEDFSYSDPANGESDIISVKLSNRDGRWSNNWLPAKGDKLTAKIKMESWDSAGKDLSFDCGKFCCDDISFAGPNGICTIGGTSVPENQAFRATERTKTWKKVTIKEIARQIAKRYGLTLKYDASSIKISSKEQSNQVDSDFLKNICDDYGLAIKVYYGKLIIYDVGKYEDKSAVTSISLNDASDWDYNTTLVGTYTGATIKYTNGSSDKELSLTVGKSGRILTISEKVDSKSDAQLKACARVNKENRSTETMTVTIKANPKIVAGVCVTIKDGNKINGKYFVDKVTHKLNADGAYTMDLELHKVQTRIKVSTSSSKKKTGYKVGDIVTFNGGYHYVSSTASKSTGGRRRSGKAKITIIKSGRKHPYHLIGGAYRKDVSGKCNVYGWVNSGTFS